MRTLSSRYRLASWDSIEDGERPVAAAFAQGWLHAWLTDPALRTEVAEVCDELDLPSLSPRGFMDERELHLYVRPAIERSLLTGRLVLLDRFRAGKLPQLEQPQELPPVSLQRDEPKPTKTWIEFLVTDMAGKPVKDVNYEVRLVDQSKHTGKTDGNGIARFEEIDPGICEIRLVDYDGEAVESLEEAERRKKSRSAADALPPPPAPDAAADAAGEIADVIYVVAAEVKDIGEALLPDHPVRIVDAESGEAVTGDLKTDEKGVVRAEVPEDKPYRIEIGETEMTPAPAQSFHPDPPHAILAVLFVGADGHPLAHEPVHVVADGAKYEMETDEKGRIHSEAPLAPCELEVRDQRFVAHALPPADADQESNLYRFVVAEEKK